MALPNLPQDILDRIATLERQVRDVSGRLSQRPPQTQIAGGDVAVYAGGSFRMLSRLGNFVQAWIGKISPNHLDGSEQRGVLLYREDGSQAFSLYTVDNNPQAIALRDRSETTIVADDVQNGGLARPYLSTDAWVGSTEAPTTTTTSGSFTGLQALWWLRQHPKIRAFYLVQTPSGTTGEIRLIDEITGLVIIPPITIASATFAYGEATGSVGGVSPVSYAQSMKLVWQARTTSGAGAIGIKGLSTYGVQS